MATRKFGLVFAGGGARGFAHVGVLHALRRDGYAPSVLVGVSMGALVATTYGLNPGWYAALQAMDISGFPRPPDFSGRGVMASIRKAVMAERALQQMYFGWGFGQPAVEWGVALLHRLIGAQPIEACCVPVFVCATDLLTGKRVVFSAGPCVGAVYASSALAGIVPPARIGGQVLVDGGYSDIAPIDVARAAGADVVIVVDPSGQPEERGAMIAVLKKGRVVAAWSVGVLCDPDRHFFLFPRQLDDPEPVEIGAAVFLLPQGPACG